MVSGRGSVDEGMICEWRMGRKDKEARTLCYRFMLESGHATVGVFRQCFYFCFPNDSARLGGKSPAW